MKVNIDFYKFLKISEKPKINIDSPVYFIMISLKGSRCGRSDPRDGLNRFHL